MTDLDTSRRLEVKAGDKVIREVGGPLLETLHIVPIAVAGQVMLEGSPDPLDEVELGTIRGQGEDGHRGTMAGEPRFHRRALVVPRVVEDQRQWCVLGGLDQLVEKGDKSSTVCPLGELTRDHASGVVERSEDRDAGIRARRRHRQLGSAPLPSLRQSWVGIDMRFIKVEEAGLSTTPFFWSSVRMTRQLSLAS